jgi:hypothetical protein
MTAVDDLLSSIFGGSRPGLRDEFEGWVRSSRRFRAFATQYQVKIRSKVNNVRDDAGLADLHAELASALILLREDRFTLEYEKYAASRQRGPDFTVTFKTHTPLNVEVRRVRGAELDENGRSEARMRKLIAILCDKAGQMPPGIVNVLWLAAEVPIAEAELNQAAAALRQLAERKTEDFFTRRGYRNAVDFLRHYSQLSGVILYQPGAVSVWLNPLARHKTPPEIVNALRQL